MAYSLPEQKSGMKYLSLFIKPSWNLFHITAQALDLLLFSNFCKVKKTLKLQANHILGPKKIYKKKKPEKSKELCKINIFATEERHWNMNLKLFKTSDRCLGQRLEVQLHFPFSFLLTYTLGGSK